MKKHRQELDVNEDLKLIKGGWATERVAWVFMLLFVVAPLLGLTGRGGIQGINENVAVSSTRDLKVTYEYFQRNTASSKIQVDLRIIGKQKVELSFSKDFYDKIRVEQVVPQPKEVYMDDQGITYAFDSKRNEMKFIFYIKPKEPGSLKIDLSSGADKLSFSQYVYF